MDQVDLVGAYTHQEADMDVETPVVVVVALVPANKQVLESIQGLLRKVPQGT